MPLARRWIPLLAAALLVLAYLIVAPGRASAAGALLSQGKTATASSAENATFPASAAVDGNATTRWSSAFADPQWLQVDLGATATIDQVTLTWEAAFARSFQIQVASSATGPFTTIFSTTTGTGGTQTLTVNGTGRFVRMNGTARATAFGYSLFEFQVFSSATGPFTTIFSTTTGTGGTQTLTVNGTGRFVRMNGTARATAFGYSLFEMAVQTTGTVTPPPSSDAFWGDLTTIPAANNVVEVKILNRTNGQFPDSQVFWTFQGVTHSIADQPFLDMPANSAGRMVFHLGSPTSQFTDFIEFTVGADVFNGNTTRVDGFGLKLAMRLRSHDGSDVQVGEDQATFAQSRAATFQSFIDSVPQEFKVLAQGAGQVRIPSPGNDPSFRAGGVNANYFSAYASSVGINAPTSDIFGCAGILAQDPDHCAALNRHVAQLPQSQWNTPSLYYGASPANWYSKFWHDHAINHLAYGFPYDDVAGQSSFISHTDPQWLLVAVGF